MNEVPGKRSMFRHPLAAVGGALFTAGGALFIILILIDITSGAENPYRALVTFMLAPAIIVLGLALFLLAVRRQVLDARRRGERIRFTLSIDPTDPKYKKSLVLFLALTAVLVIVVVYSGTRAYDATDSVAFCGTTCHTIMSPQYVTYQNSPHARVPCAHCHIGPGASFWVKSKMDGLRQVYATIFKTYSRPIVTPVKELRPAQETCEECHWPRQFYGEKMVTRRYYRTDEANSPWTIGLLVKIGGGNPHSGWLEGIHWQMIVANRVEYIATDPKRQIIPWVRAINAAGDTSIYTMPGADVPDPNDPNVEVRRFDCMDCHNRPSHLFAPPAKSLNLALSTRQISRDLPFIRQVGLDLLNGEYASTDDALQAIASKLPSYYQEKYPELARSAAADIDAAVRALQEIYRTSFFPEMKTDYRARENHLSHFVNDGCFRCHDGVKQTADGKKIANGCTTCHLIVAQGPSEESSGLATNLAGLEFQHPEDISDAWKETKCTDCHDPQSGY
jgi:hypothetical protein